MTDNRNVILAIVLSMIVLFGWQFFIAGPQLERAQQQAQVVAEQQAQADAALAVPAATTADGVAPAAVSADGAAIYADRASAPSIMSTVFCKP